MTLLVAAMVVSSVAVNVQERERVSLGDALDIADRFARAIESHRGGRARVDSADWSSCGRSDGCLDEVLRRTGADEVVFLRIFAGAKRIRVAARRVGEPVRTADTDLLIAERASWGDALRGLASSLFEVSETRSAAPPKMVVEPPPPSPRGSIAPWIVLGGSVAVAGAGLAVGLVARTDSNTLRSNAFPPAQHEALTSRVQSRTLAANVLFGVAAAGLVGSVVWWLLDSPH